MKQYVIIGNGTAAAACIEGIRSVDQQGAITVISGEKRPVYCRPLISYYLQGKTDEKRMLYRAQDFYDKNACTVLYGKKAVKLDVEKKIVQLDDGEEISYDQLCVASGSTPFVPPTAGLDTVGEYYTFLTMEDALALEKAVQPEHRVLIVGAGLIGLKCAEGLKDRCSSITVCDLADRVLSSILDNDGSRVTEKTLCESGISLYLGDVVDRFDGKTAYMKSGAVIEFDTLVMAVGVRPCTGFFKEAGGAVGRGITVDEKMQTSLPDIYAAGDCTESRDMTDGQVKIMALMPNANLQGHAAGVNMAGGKASFDQALPMNSIGFFGLHMMTAGTRNQLFINEVSDTAVKKLYWDGRHLTGFELVGEVKNAGIYLGLIRRGEDITAIPAEYFDGIPDMRIFEQEKRNKVLRGEL